MHFFTGSSFHSTGWIFRINLGHSNSNSYCSSNANRNTEKTNKGAQCSSLCYSLVYIIINFSLFISLFCFFYYYYWHHCFCVNHHESSIAPYNSHHHHRHNLVFCFPPSLSLSFFVPFPLSFLPQCSLVVGFPTSTSLFILMSYYYLGSFHFPNSNRHIVIFSSLDTTISCIHEVI